MHEFRRLLGLLRPYRAAFALSIVAMVVVALFETAIGALLIPIFQQFMPGTGSASRTIFDLQRFIPANDWFRAWLTIAGMLLSFTVCKAVAEYFSSYLMAKIGQSVVLELRERLYEHIIGQSSSFFERHRTNFLVSRLVVSCQAIENSVAGNLRDLLREGCYLIFFFSAAVYLNWRLAIGAAIATPILALITTRFSRSLRRLAEEYVEGNKELTDTAQESIANNMIVKAYRAETRERARFTQVARRIAKAHLRSGRIAAISPPVIDLVGTISIIALFYFGLREIDAGRMEAAQFFGFLFFLFRSYDPIRKISKQHNEINRAFAAAKDIWDVLDEDDRVVERENAVELGPLTDKLEFRKVDFAYRGQEKQILHGINLDVARGTMIALVGESGGGKTSLIKLVQRLYDVTGGAILWDGTDIRDAKIESLRRQIALVTQETVLFNDTIRYNIAYSRPDASDDDIREAARVAFADEFIENLPKGYDTFVGERGVLLSGGQRQRIAIARAVLANAELLILDEATSALDTESERLVQQAIANVTQNRTSIVIAHRLSTVVRADRIVVMDRGRIVEEGTHAELLDRGGRYALLHKYQFEAAEPTA